MGISSCGSSGFTSTCLDRVGSEGLIGPIDEGRSFFTRCGDATGTCDMCGVTALTNSGLMTGFTSLIGAGLAES